MAPQACGMEPIQRGTPVISPKIQELRALLAAECDPCFEKQDYPTVGDTF